VQNYDHGRCRGQRVVLALGIVGEAVDIPEPVGMEQVFEIGEVVGME